MRPGRPPAFRRPAPEFAIAHGLIWTICAASMLGVLARPRGIPEWVWALGGAALLAIFGLLSWGEVSAAVRRGTDVYFFLAGMMAIAEIARREDVFDWVAGHAVRAAGGSRRRLFGLVYAFGIGVTAVLSNDATAVVLTPAVAAAVRKAEAEPLPYLFACAFVANAASFVLPISNPANLVVFGAAIPALPRWLEIFTVPSLLSIAVTFAALALVWRGALRGSLSSAGERTPLGPGGRIALGGICVTAALLIAASAFGAPLGAVTSACAAVVLGAVALRERAAFRTVLGAVSWEVLPLVAGLFVLVQGLADTGLLRVTRHAAATAAAWPPGFGLLAAAGVTAGASNLINNLPAGLIAGTTVATLHGHDALRAAIAIGIDLGPNLSVTGSLATVLWLIALRRERIDVDAWTFFRVGALVMPPALVLAVAGVLVIR